MTTLPASIEAYLVEAGFSGTELLILKRLLEGDALTLRELAAKTGKSTGVLDQAMKKLLDRKIISREIINDTPKFTVASLEAISVWVKEDMHGRHAVLHRKQQDFEAFLSTLHIDKGRPEMEYFEGDDGIKQAYLKLLENTGEWLCYEQAVYKEEEDPLREFRVQLFRERRKRKIFARVIAPEGFLGKRFQSRDVFEYRQTKLVTKDQMPVQFEKIVAGNTVACFNHTEGRVCFIKFQELADTQKRVFEMLWCMQSGGTEESCSLAEGNPAPAVASIETKTLSGLREFFLSRKSIVTMAFLAVISGIITFGLYQQNLYLNTQRIREKVRAVAATAAATFTAGDLAVLRSTEDMDTGEYRRVVNALDFIRSQNPGVKYAYIVRPRQGTDTFEFVADADGLRIGQGIDFNDDGIIGPEDEIPVPGKEYDVSEIPGVMIGTKEAVSMDESFTDQWGKFISGFAPIRDRAGNTIAVLGIDQIADDAATMTQESFAPLLWLLGLFVVFMLVRLAAFNKSLYQEIVVVLRQQSLLFILCLGVGIAALGTYAIYFHTAKLNLERLREKTIAIAATSALQFSGEELDSIRTPKDVETVEYERVTRRLLKIQQDNENIAYVYIIRPTQDSTLYEFVSSNDALDPYHPFDVNGDGRITDADEISLPGDRYDITDMDALQHGPVAEPTANQKLYTDQWGTFITAYAPIRRTDGTVAGLLSVDIRVEALNELNKKAFSPLLYFLSIFALFVVIRLVAFHKTLTANIVRLSRSKKFLASVIMCAVLALCITYALYLYTLKLMKVEVGNRLLSIASTAAPEIDYKDMEGINFMKDMSKPQYQKLFNKLNEIRDRNSDLNLQYVYILRPSKYANMFEFVADADSNLLLLNFKNAPEVISPGTQYDIGLLALKNHEGELLTKSIAQTNVWTDKWGMYLSATSPILNEEGKGIAILGVDLDISQFHNQVNEKFKFLFWFFVISSLILFARLLSFRI